MLEDDSSRSDSESNLMKVLRNLLPNDAILHCNFRHPQLVHNISGLSMELDAYCPTYHIAFEFQGQQHYESYFKGQLKKQKVRDSEKKKACQSNQITLIDIPYWWDGSETTLFGTIHNHRPDIPLNPPQSSERPPKKSTNRRKATSQMSQI